MTKKIHETADMGEPSDGEENAALHLPSSRTRRRGKRNRRRGDIDGLGQAPPWLISFTDIMALMLTFFVLLYAMSTPEEKSWSEIMAALQREFHVYNGPRHEAGPQDVVNLDRVNFSRALPLAYIRSLLASLGEEEGAEAESDLFSVQATPQSLVISLSAESLFESGRVDMTEGGVRQLYKLASVLARIRNRIEVVGHSDPAPITNPESQFRSNWDLSLERAATVAAVLRQTGYLRPVTLKGAGSVHYQDLPPDLPSEIRDGYSRRVDIHIMMDDGSRTLVQRLRLE
ncbi:MAG: OmpA family protein [Rhodospirillales bacterium]|nr:OmpA family protein [Rhodospirillales bacterium]MCB9965288.1 OmpA family protein [Rhodospirillales bacterium]MCB9972943.1 OmpA family protein [Rhodospirillales bacterium]MCB9980119.1 OmpA family protein [Rhodospirillales bacterium]